MVVGERTRDVLVMVVLHSGHSAVCMGEKRIGGRGGGLVAVGRAICWTPRPCGLVVHLRRVLVGGELVGNARGLLRVVHGREMHLDVSDVFGRAIHRVCLVYSDIREEYLALTSFPATSAASSRLSTLRMALRAASVIMGAIFSIMSAEVMGGGGGPGGRLMNACTAELRARSSCVRCSRVCTVCSWEACILDVTATHE